MDNTTNSNNSNENYSTANSSFSTNENTSSFISSNSISQSDYSSSSHIDNSEIAIDLNPESMEKKNVSRTKKRLCSGMILFFLLNVCLILLNFVLFALNRNKTQTQNPITPTPHSEKTKYQIISHEFDGKTTSKIVELSNNEHFNKDFIPYENEEESGVMVKLDYLGDEYRMCNENCECVVECENNDHCTAGFECKEYKCVDTGLKKKRETNIERKVAQVITIAIPAAVCIYGIFTTYFLAQNYGNNYFADKCDEECPTNSEGASAQTDVNKVDDSERQYEFFCEGMCKPRNELLQLNLAQANQITSFCRDFILDGASHSSDFTGERARNSFFGVLDSACKQVKYHDNASDKPGNNLCVGDMVTIKCTKKEIDMPPA